MAYIVLAVTFVAILMYTSYKLGYKDGKDSVNSSNNGDEGDW